MKKMLIAGAAALALLMSGCMMFEDPAEEAEFDEYGRRVVSLSIFTGDNNSSRNLSLDLAQALINYFEVSFYDDGSNGGTAGATNSENYKSVSGPRGKVLTIRLRTGQPIGGANRAVVFGGYWNKKTDERTLLAVGEVTGINNVTAADDVNMLTGTGDFVIVANTRAIRFAMTAITTRFDSYTGPGVDSPTNRSSFKFSVAPNTGVLAGYGYLRHRIFDFNDTGGKVYPYFTLPTAVLPPANPDRYTATLTFGGITTSLAGGIYVNQLTNIALEGTPTVNGGQIDVWSLLMEGDESVTLVRAIATNIPGTGLPFPATVNITIQPTGRPYREGWVMIVPNFDVRAINDITRGTGISAREPDTWTLSNGITFYEPHDNQSAGEFNETTGVFTPNAAPNDTGGSSMGGGILLCIGNPQSVAPTGRAIKIIVVGPPPPLSP
ncbi:MAG: hypothetical protein LBH97_01775 [Treponema sp.]|jgi:hypothetical protein|nr:hypothetical protein [Treponema sp.]